jgi:opacity protein-like surface antigen
MKKIGYVVIFATLVSFILLTAVSEAGGFDFFKQKPSEEGGKKIVGPGMEKARVKRTPRIKRKKPFCLVLGRELVIGIEETHTAERDFEHDSFPEGDIQFETLQHLGTLSYEIISGFTLNGKIGVAYIKNDSWSFGKHDYKLAWGVGAEWNVFKGLNECFPNIPDALPYGIDMLVTGEYFTIDADKLTNTGVNTLDEEWQEWNTAIILSKTYGAFTPYIGARVSWAEVKVNLDYGTTNATDFYGTLEADHQIGSILGLDLDFSECGILRKSPFIRNLSLNLEARAFDEVAFTGGLNYTHKF